MRIDCTKTIKTDWHEEKQLDTKTRKNLKKTNTVCYQCWSPRYIVSVSCTKCGGCHPKGLIVASLCKIKIIMITILLFTRKFSFLLDKNKNHMKLTCKFWFVCRKNLKGLLAYLISYFANSIRRKFSTNGGISSLT